ncbi:trans-4-hydroxy-L-proline dehydratase activase [Paraclostridium bifermentans]|uniref:trans-4-hydroxy-L-proline dehydratase activase n=1 Tax=Paraclostridium bifermentans TaxID=1490 RepID=UPI00359C9471
MKKPLILNIQKYSLHDGDGIRTTVFFKGCPLECIWCHNPESQAYNKEVLYNEEKCTKCEVCIDKCPHKAIYKEENNICLNKNNCEFCETCLDYCLNNAREIVGKTYEIKDLMREIVKDMMFYEESGGGVTLSGGEVMTQDVEYIKAIASLCKEKGISVAIDTCGYARFENYEAILPFVDTFLYDIKLIDEEKHKLFTNKSNDLILENLIKLSENGANINIRIPLIEGVNVDKENIEVKKIIDFIKPLNIKKVNLLPYHNIGMHKYKKLYMDYEGQNLNRPSDEKLEEIKQIFITNNFETKIGG